MQRSQTVGSVTTTDSFLYTYGSSGASQDRTEDVIWRQTVDAGAWTNIRRVVYTYYDGTDSFGSLGDLKTAVTQEWDGSAWDDLGTSYYRYYKSGDTNGFAHGLRYALNPQAFQNLSDDPNVTDPYTASNAIVSLYADYYFEYDTDQRVTKETIKGGSQAHTFGYTESSNTDGFHSWKYKTTETLPDSTQKIVFCNYAGQPMLQVFKSGTDEWLSYIEYDSDSREILLALPSAISGYDDTHADLNVTLKASALTIPWATYTSPELAHVGVGPDESKQEGFEIDTYTQPLSGIDRAILEEEDEGFVRVHVKKGTDMIVGATIVATNAGDLIDEITLAMTHGLDLKQIASTIHPYPTQGEAIRKVGDLYNRTRLTPFVRNLFEKWLAWTR